MPEKKDSKETTKNEVKLNTTASDIVSATGVDVTELLDQLVAEALERKASDIHIEPQEDHILVRYRIDGILIQVHKYEKSLAKGLVFKIKVTARLRTDEHFAPQDGRIQFLFNGKKLDTRISILPTTKGEKVVIRLLTSEGKSFTLEDLGMEGRDLEVVKKSYAKPYGMILATGPTGSGKTTTLYSILRELNSTETNITTVEDPVEYDLAGVNHVQVNTKADLTFANGLRSILRQDPDIIMIGEIRDRETASIAINAAMTGHLVLSTLHTNDSVTTIPRLMDMGIERYLVAATINVIVAQRLSRKLCDKCKKEYKITEEILTAIKKMRPDIASFLKVGEALYEAGKCEECETGYKGRVGLYEVMQITEDLRRAISEGANVDDIFAISRKNGLTLIVEAGIVKLRLGLLDIAELIRVTAIKE